MSIVSKILELLEHRGAASGYASLDGSSVVEQQPPAIDAAKITSGRFGVGRLGWTANKLLKGAGTGASPTEIDMPEAVYVELTVQMFQFFPATGTAAYTPECLNDNSTAAYVNFNAVGQYAQVMFVAPSKITQFRQYGHTAHKPDGTYTLQYMNAAGSWVTWVDDIPVRDFASWGDWDSSGGEVLALGIRLVVKLRDTNGNNLIYELEVKY